MSNADREQLIARYLKAYNGFDVEGMLAVLTPDIHFENHAEGRLTHVARGIVEFAALAEEAKALFAWRELRVIALAFEEDAVVAEIVFRGQLVADPSDRAAADVVIELRGQSEFFFDGVRIGRIIDRS